MGTLRAGVRKLLVFGVALCALALAGPGLASPQDTRSILTAKDSVEAPTISRINTVRRQHGLRPLTVSWRLARAAESHAISMGKQGYFSHTSSDGTVFWKRIQRFYGSKGYSYWTVGENLLWASPDVTPAEAVRMWLNSREHRKIMLSRAWTQMGISAVHVTNAPGVYHGLDVTIVAADFGARR